MRVLLPLLVIAAGLASGCSAGEDGTSAATKGETATPAPNVIAAGSATPTVTPTPLASPSPSPTVSPTPIPIYHRAPFTVAIEAGHGGPYYWGGSARDSDGNLWIEKDVNLDLALRLNRLLVEAGYGTVLLRDGDYTLTPFDAGDYRGSQRAEAQARVNMANERKADALVSIHFNGWHDASQRGTETYCNPDRSFGQESCALAWYVQDALVRRIWGAGYEINDRGVRNDADVGGDPENAHSFLLGTNRDFAPSLMPGVIAEMLFLSNPEDMRFLRTVDALDVMARAIKEGIDRYFFEWLAVPAQ